MCFYVFRVAEHTFPRRAGNRFTDFHFDLSRCTQVGTLVQNGLNVVCEHTSIKSDVILPKKRAPEGKKVVSRIQTLRPHATPGSNKGVAQGVAEVAGVAAGSQRGRRGVAGGSH